MLQTKYSFSSAIQDFATSRKNLFFDGSDAGEVSDPVVNDGIGIDADVDGGDMAGDDVIAAAAAAAIMSDAAHDATSAMDVRVNTEADDVSEVACMIRVAGDEDDCPADTNVITGGDPHSISSKGKAGGNVCCLGSGDSRAAAVLLGSDGNDAEPEATSVFTLTSMMNNFTDNSRRKPTVFVKSTVRHFNETEKPWKDRTYEYSKKETIISSSRMVGSFQIELLMLSMNQ